MTKQKAITLAKLKVLTMKVSTLIESLDALEWPACAIGDKVIDADFIALRNHLDLARGRAGTREQSQVIEKWLDNKDIRYDYTLACEYLKSIGLYEVRGYKYGHAWLVELIDEKDLDSIRQIVQGAA